MYEFFEHTADLGLRVRAPDLNRLFRDAAMGLFAMVVEELPRGRTSSSREFTLRGRRHDYLLFDWLNELLFVFDTRRLVLSKFYVDEIDEHHLDGMAIGMKYDSTRHHQRLEIKAVTYHRLQVAQDEGGRWRAEIIFDI